MNSSGKENSLSNLIIKNLKEALLHHHLGSQQSELYPHITACMDKWEQLTSSLITIDTLLSFEDTPHKNQLLIEKAILEILQDPQQNRLEELKLLLSDKVEFYHDIVSSLKLLITPAEKFTVIETDDPNHFLLMGTEVENSCQAVHKDANLNKCLLGYFLDGKHRLSLVCDSQNKMVARSVLRLLIDDEGQPVLFQERIYVADANPIYKQLLRKIALKKAARLKIPLVRSLSDFEDEKLVEYPYILKAKDKPVPFEYVDALKGIKTDIYEITDAIQFFS